ncbi:MAG TPA: CocE/NonD family hydrolase [Pseudomonadales bacterium]
MYNKKKKGNYHGLFGNLRRTGLILLATFFAAAAALCAAAVAHAQAQDNVVRSSLYVPVRDGTRLAMNVYRPARDGIAVDTPLPVIFMFTPYRARYRNADGAIVELAQARSLGLDRLLASGGYVIAEADVRGKGASFGARRGFQDRTEAQDGYDLVQWLAGQPWSNGVVGMAGCSYLGGSTVQVATTRPPALKAIFAGASDLDKFDFVRNGGITAQFNTRPDEPLSDDLMSVPMGADSDGALLRAAVAEHAANTPMAALWYGMPFRDSVSPLTGNAFWEEVGPYSYLDALRAAQIPAYFWSNLQDEPTSQMILAAANLDAKLLVGPGTHCVPPPDIDLGAELQRFFDRHLKGIDTGIDRDPKYQWWVENAPEGEAWIRSDRLPGADATQQVWHLGMSGTANDAATTEAAGRSDDTNAQASSTGAAQGVFATAPQPAGERQLTVDYDLGAGEYFAFWVDSQADRGLVFGGEPLAQDLHLEGYPVAELTVASDRDDINVFVYLEEQSADGSVTVLSNGRLAASYRATADAPYDTLGLPWHPGRERDHQPLVPGVPVELDIAMLPVSRIVPAGSRLRFVVTGADPRQRNLADIRQDPPPVMTLTLGGESARVSLPVRE